jgi:bifunctional DNA-binding transcriptional regulator/antitoxin component of YhaV-PrlF toxin-antitoxin module
MLAVGKITAKGRTTVPLGVRAALNLVSGDSIAWSVQPDGTVTVRRVQPLDIESLRAIESTLVEWAGAADEEAFRAL